MSTYLVVGGASGIGEATAMRLAEAGHQVAVADLNPQAAQVTASCLAGSNHVSFGVDVRDRESVDRLLESVMSRFDHLGGIAACAGLVEPAPSDQVSDEAIERLLDIHLLGSIRLARAAYPYLKASARGSSIVMMSSMGAHLGIPERLGYCAAKGGIEAAVKTLAVEWASVGIRVNSVAPGWVKTPAIANIIDSGFLDIDPIIRRTPEGRLAEPSEIAEILSFLLSTASSYITGSVVIADGGMTVQGPTK